MTGPDASFEETLAALEERVRRIEAGEISLDEALDLYEQGVRLAQACHEQLEAAEKRVSQLRRGPAGVDEEPLADVDE